MVVDDGGIQNSDGHITHYGKLWECDILTAHSTAPHIILHEQLHARSISYYDGQVYTQYRNIEESAVQLMAEEICIKEGIEVIRSDYDELTEALKQIADRIGILGSYYDFAKILLEIPVEERLGWLSDKLYDTLGSEMNATVEEYEKYSELLNMLY